MNGRKHKLITAEIRRKLINAAKVPGHDKPVVKLFSPYSKATWLIACAEIDEDDLRMFGLCDLGHGFPEMGYVSYNELESLAVFGSVPAVERDLHWTPAKSLLEYTEEAQRLKRVVA